MTAAFWALVALAASGAVTQGGSISETVGANLILGTTFTPLSATTGLLVAATFMTFGVYSGYPVPAAFATTGAMVGVGLSLGGDPALDTYRRIGRSGFWSRGGRGDRFGGVAGLDGRLDRPPFGCGPRPGAFDQVAARSSVA